MLDTGHLLHAKLDLETQEQSVYYIIQNTRAHGEMNRKSERMAG